MGKILVVKKKDEGKVRCKVTDKVTNNYTHTDYNTTIDVRDYKQLAFFFNDLKLIFDAPIDKAYKEHQKNNNPFW